MYLAHGTLGPWDEMIFIGVAAIFFIMMGISWVRSRAEEPDLMDAASPSDSDDPDSADHIRLD
jgi:hypothetical protein